jgi:hypothetical protein
MRRASMPMSVAFPSTFSSVGKLLRLLPSCSQKEEAWGGTWKSICLKPKFEVPQCVGSLYENSAPPFLVMVSWMLVCSAIKGIAHHATLQRERRLVRKEASSNRSGSGD